MRPERRSGLERRQRTEGPPETHGERRNGIRDRRGRHRAAALREGAAWVLAIAGVAIAAWAVFIATNATGEAERATEAARVTAERVAEQTAEDTRANALAAFQGCRRANRETRPAARAGILVLRDLVLAVNDGTDPSLQPPAFRGAPKRLQDALRKLQPTDCPAAYRAGWQVWIEEGRPAP